MTITVLKKAKDMYSKNYKMLMKETEDDKIHHDKQKHMACIFHSNTTYFLLFFMETQDPKYPNNFEKEKQEWRNQNL